MAMSYSAVTKYSVEPVCQILNNRFAIEAKGGSAVICLHEMYMDYVQATLAQKLPTRLQIMHGLKNVFIVAALFLFFQIEWRITNWRTSSLCSA